MSTDNPFLPSLRRRVVLASQSPRRAEILRQQGVDFEVIPSSVEELEIAGEDIAAMVCRLARDKAAHVAALHPDAMCIGSDTMVVLDGARLGKPVDVDDAVRMLCELRGRGHEVWSSVAMICAERDYAAVEAVRSLVRFRDASDEDIHAYVRTGEPMDKAGAYGIQAFGALLVNGLEGCYFNVMGLPVQALRRQWLAFAASDLKDGSI